MLRYQNWELKSPRSDFLELSIGFLELQCKIWVGKHTFFQFLTPVLNSPDRDVLKNGFKWVHIRTLSVDIDAAGSFLGSLKGLAIAISLCDSETT